jgi:acetoin utilization protein AcuB
MTFMICSQTGNNRIPLEEAFKACAFEKMSAPPLEDSTGTLEHHGAAGKGRQRSARVQTGHPDRHVPIRSPVVLAEQVMTTPVVTITPDAPVENTLQYLRTNSFRHIPVVSSSGRLVGIVSQCDILRYMAGLPTDRRIPVSPASDGCIEQLMAPRVLAASIDTDVRFIVRLFIEQHIGAMPVTKDDMLKGIITRTDVLEAIMRHYTLEL